MYQIGTLLFDNPLYQLKQNILHVDMDAFYASVAERDDPSLKGKPVIMARHPNETGGTGIITTANYEARKYGVHSGMSSAEAYRRCPEATFVPVNHTYLRSVSRELFEIYSRYTTIIQRVSLDEAYLQLLPDEDGEAIAREIQKIMKEETGLTCSIGVSYNKIMAKMGSDANKPEGITIIRPQEAVDFLDPMEVRDFHGIGPKTAEQLYSRDIYTIADMRVQTLEQMTEIFGSNAQRMIDRINGVDPAPVRVGREPKSSGNERTYHPFLETNAEIRKAIVEIIDILGDTLRRDQTYGTTVVLKIRDGEFQNYSKRVGVNYLFNDKATLYDLAIECWMELRSKIMHPIRLVGVTLVGLDQQEDGSEGQSLLF